MVNAMKPQCGDMLRKLHLSAGRVIVGFSLAIIVCCLFMVRDVFSQGIIQGHVTDADTKEGLVGVNIKLSDLKGIGTRTDSKGNYKIINVPPGKHTIQVHLIGYGDKVQSVSIEGDQTITSDFNLSVQALKQDEVVVLGLSGEVDRSKLGNAITTVNGNAVRESISPSAIDALSGRVPGLVVNKASGTPGGGTFITIRGRHTISGSSEPLYVVDGVVIDNSSVTDSHFQGGNVALANRAVDISAEDIESIDVLKGPSASAIYGSLAANGVVLITTRHAHPIAGGTQNANITYSQYVESNSSAGRPGSDLLQTIYGQAPGSNTSYGPLLDTVKPSKQVYDHIGELLKPHTSSEEQLTVSGGNPEFSYYASAAHNNLEGLIDNSKYLKNNVQVNLQLVPFSMLSIRSNSNFIDINNDLPQDGSNRAGLLLGGMRTPPEFNNTIVYNPDGSQHRYASYDNPFWSVQNNSFNSSVQRFIHSTEASLSPLDWLTMTGRIGLDKYSQTNAERLAVGSGNNLAPSRQGEIDKQTFDQSSVNLDFTAVASFKSIEDLSHQFILGGQTLWSQYSNVGTTSTFTLPFYNQISAGSSQVGQSSLVETKVVGTFAQLTSTYVDRYTLTLGLRRDGSSTFGANTQFHYYPKASFALVLPVENTGILSSLKIRGGYGQAGSPGLPGAYSTNLLYSIFGNNDGWQRLTSAGRNGLTGIRQGGGNYNTLFLVGNPIDIAPEITTEAEIGLDIGLFENRVNIEATFYHSNVNNLILNVPVSGSTGYDLQLKNAGAMRNEGWELAITALPIKTEDFAWTTTVIYSQNRNLVTSLSGATSINIYGFQDIENVAIVGQPLGVFYGVGWKRDANGKVLYTTGTADDYFGNDFKGAPQIDPNPQVLGDPNPKFALSWLNELKIMKNLTVGFLFDGVFGPKIWNGTKTALYNFGTAKETADRNEPWIFDGHPVIDNTTGKPVTREQYYRQYGNNFSNVAESAMEDGSYIKLREVNISYDWDGLTSLHINKVRFTLTGRNLFTITKYTGLDPEVNNFAQSEARGFDYFNLPPLRSFRFGVILTY